MQISRRNFLQTAGAVVAVIASSSGLRVFGQTSDELFPIPPEIYSHPMFSLTARHAEGLIGTTFMASVAGGRQVAMTLTQVNRLERQANTLGGYYGESFSLIFESAQRLKLNQGVYRLTGAGLEMESVLIVPIGLERNRFEVLVNHITR